MKAILLFFYVVLAQEQALFSSVLDLPLINDLTSNIADSLSYAFIGGNELNFANFIHPEKSKALFKNVPLQKMSKSQSLVISLLEPLNENYHW